MQIKPGFAMRKIAGSNIVVPVGAASSDFNGMITLNDTGAFLWNCFLQPTTEAQVVEALMHEYEVERQRAAAAAGERFAGGMRNCERQVATPKIILFVFKGMWVCRRQRAGIMRCGLAPRRCIFNTAPSHREGVFSAKKCQKREKRGDLLTLIPFSCTVISTGVSYLALYHNKHARFTGT